MTTHQTDHHADDERTQLVIEISPALRQRIERAAARGDLSTQAYVEELLERTVPAEATQQASEPTRGQPVTPEFAVEMRRTREEWARNHPGVEVEDSVELIRRMREERTEHLMRAIEGE